MFFELNNMLDEYIAVVTRCLQYKIWLRLWVKNLTFV